MKLLFVISSMSAGGAERVCANLANHWASKGWQITIVTIFGQDRDFYTLHPAVRRIALNLGRESRNPVMAVVHNWRRARALRAVLLAERPDIALALMDRNNVLLALAAKGLGMVTIGSEHTHPPQAPQHALWNMLRRRHYGRLDAVVALTDKSAEWIRRNTSACHVPVIPNPVPWPMPVQEPIVPPPEKRGCRLLAVGRLVPLKQFGLLIEVFCSLAQTHPEWELAILGDGPEKDRLREMAARGSCPDRIILPGRVGNLGDWYGSADLYVMTSQYEGFPNTLAEALAHGVPAVSFDCDTGPRDIIRDGIDGRLVEPGDRKVLALTLAELMGNKNMRKHLAQRSIDVRDRLSLDRIATAWETEFDRLVREPKDRWHE